jgi:hypothetical protein
MQGPAEKVLLARQGLNTACSSRHIVSILGQRRNNKKLKKQHTILSTTPGADGQGSRPPLRRGNPPKKPPLSIEVQQTSLKESLKLHTTFLIDPTLTMETGKETYNCIKGQSDSASQRTA